MVGRAWENEPRGWSSLVRTGPLSLRARAGVRESGSASQSSCNKLRCAHLASAHLDTAPDSGAGVPPAAVGRASRPPWSNGNRDGCRTRAAETAAALSGAVRGCALHAWLLLLFYLLLAPSARAHQPGESYLTLRLTNAVIRGQWDIALRDLDATIGLDANGDGAVTWDELRARHKAILNFALPRLAVRVNGVERELLVTEQQVASYPDGVYSVVLFTIEDLHRPRQLEVSYRLFFDTHPAHRALVNLDFGGTNQIHVFSVGRATQQFDLTKPDTLRELADFGAEGVTHIWGGFDHVLFLVALLLPAVLQREGSGWRAAESFRPALVNVVQIVTAFTLAHSLTLTLAVLELVTLPSRLVESAIAASVVLAAWNNLRPLVRERVWLFAFGFGLLHGFGFASALAGFGLKSGSLLAPLVGFNLGVELGQLVIVIGFLPLAWALRGSWFYQQLTLRLGSTFVLLLAATWMVQRLFDLPLLPF